MEDWAPARPQTRHRRAPGYGGVPHRSVQLRPARPARLQAAHRNGRLPQELVRLRRYGLIIVDEVGYIPFEQDVANLFFQLVSSRHSVLASGGGSNHANPFGDESDAV